LPRSLSRGEALAVERVIFMNSIIETIKETRKKKHITQYEFAEMLGIGAAHYCRIEAGKIKPRVDLVEKMLKILKLKIVQIYEIT